MIETLQELLPDVLKSIRNALGYSPEGARDEWESLVIDRRKPHTTRAFRMFGENRVCLHVFEPCEAKECFSHPHPWPGAFLMLKGEYIHHVGCTNYLTDKNVKWIARELVRPDTFYEITSPFTWHGVHPLKTSFTIMLNGPEFENKHEETRTTKGKDLKSLDFHSLLHHLTSFEVLLTSYLERFPITSPARSDV